LAGGVGVTEEEIEVEVEEEVVIWDVVFAGRAKADPARVAKRRVME